MSVFTAPMTRRQIEEWLGPTRLGYAAEDVKAVLDDLTSSIDQLYTTRQLGMFIHVDSLLEGNRVKFRAEIFKET